MSIIVNNLSEEVLTKAEKAIVRGIYRAHQLNEAVLALEKCYTSLDKLPDKTMSGEVEPVKVTPLKAYLLAEITTVLENIRIPKQRQQ